MVMDVTEQLIEALTRQPGPAVCWGCGEYGCSEFDPEMGPACTCGCHRWQELVHAAARRVAADVAVLGDLVEALEAMSCQNCDDRRCMACVCREVHDSCVDDCPECVPQERVHHRFTDRHRSRRIALERYRAWCAGNGLDEQPSD